MALFPYFEMGWNVVNVEYRLEKISPAPAAVEDCLCALRWIGVHARDYNIDVTKLVVTGESAGGHLALTTGMIPMSAGLDRQCPGPDLPKVAAILDWYGITDVNDLLDGPNQKSYAVQWLGSLPNRGRDRQAGFALGIRARGPASDSDDSGRRRSDGAVLALRPLA